MHEMAICEAIRGVLEDQARSQGFTRVERVTLAIGALSGVEIEALRFGFDVAMRGSLAEQADLAIEAVPGAAWCMPCAANVAIPDRLAPCPACGSYQLQVTGGEEMTIRELEVV